MRIFCQKCQTEMTPVWNENAPEQMKLQGFASIIQKGTHKNCGGTWRVDPLGKESDFDWSTDPNGLILKQRMDEQFKKGLNLHTNEHTFNPAQPHHATLAEADPYIEVADDQLPKIWEDKKKNKVQKLVEIFSLPVFQRVTMQEDLPLRLNMAKSFLLDVEKVQPIYDRATHSGADGEFALPFLDTLLVLEKPLIIKWTEGKLRKDYVDVKLHGILIFAQQSRVGVTGGGQMVEDQAFKAYLFLQDITEEESFIVSTQFIIIKAITVQTTDGLKYTRLDPIDHYPCQNPALCSLTKEGTLKEFAKGLDKPYFCQEVLVRDALLETIHQVINKIHEVQVIPKKKTQKGSIAPKIPKELLMVKKAVPKANYYIPLAGKRYKYEKDDIDYGSGTKHQYRYDVRRHPRVINGHLVWVGEHTRGQGSYIKGIRTNIKGYGKKWFVSYVYYQAEQLTKYRIFELLMIKALTLLRRKI